MKISEILAIWVDALTEAGVDYMLTGSLASNCYGIARSTEDADFVVVLAHDQLRAVCERVEPTFTLEPQVQLVNVTGTMKNVFYGPRGFIVELFELSRDAFDHERFARRVKWALADREVTIPTAEDVVVQKLRWGVMPRREKDLVDVRAVITVQGDALDWVYIRRWTEAHETTHLLERVLRETGRA